MTPRGLSHRFATTEASIISRPLIISSPAGVTPENNAAIPILKALGRQAIPRYQPPDGLTDRLGMKPLPKDGDYFIPYDDYCKQHGSAPTQWSDLTNPRPWPITFDDITRQWIRANEKPLLFVTKASTRTRFLIPFYAGYRPETMIEIQLPYVKLKAQGSMPRPGDPRTDSTDRRRYRGISLGYAGGSSAGAIARTAADDD